jgi:hypothetical protein
VSLAARQLIHYRREGFIAARVTALAGLVIGRWLFLIFDGTYSARSMVWTLRE